MLNVMPPVSEGAGSAIRGCKSDAANLRFERLRAWGSRAIIRTQGAFALCQGVVLLFDHPHAKAQGVQRVGDAGYDFFVAHTGMVKTTG